MDETYSFGAWVGRRRRALRLTQREVAGIVACSVVLIQKIEADARRPSHQVATRLAKALRIPADQQTIFVRAARAELAPSRLPAPESEDQWSARAALQPQHAATPAHAAGNLPIQVSSFHGRARELEDLHALLHQASTRLITLTGAGGSGKTRLALQVAERVQPRYPHGVWFIDLAPVSTPDQVIPTIAQTLGIPESSDHPRRAHVLSWLRQRRLVLILDNCEHVIEVAADVVAELLSHTASVTVLATSRMPLRISAEQEYAVAPLSIPESGALPPIEQLRHYDAVALFLARARAVQADVALTHANAPAIAEICARLDGLPLALELAAARVRMFPPDQLRSRLIAARLQTLTGGVRDLPARQQTIRATIDWSYRLLSPAQQRLLARLGVFVGGWTLTAAEAVCGEAATDMVESMDALVTQSLVQIQVAGGEARYTLLETIRAYALERLQEQHETEQIHQLHAVYFTRLAEEAEHRLRSGDQRIWLTRLAADDKNLQAALVWCLQRPNVDREHQTLGLRAAISLWYYWFLGGRFLEGCTWLVGPYTYDSEIPASARVAALSWAAVLQSRPVCLLSDAAARYADQADALAQVTDAPGITILPIIARATNYMGFLEYVPQTEEAIAILQKEGATWLNAFATIHLAKLFAGHAHEHRRAIRLCAAALATAQAIDDSWLIAEAQSILGYYHVLEGEYRVAEQFERDALIRFQAIGALHSGAAALMNLSNIAVDATGDIPKARRLQIERLALEQAIGNTDGVVAVLNSLCELALLQGDYQSAQRYAQMVPRVGHQWPIDHLLATVAFGCHDFEQALAHLGGPWPPTSEGAHTPDVLALRARIALAQGDLTTAQMMLHAALAQASDEVDIWLLACQVYLYGKDLPAAQHALVAAQRWLKTYLPLFSRRTSAQFLQAQIDLATGQITGVASQLQHCLASYRTAGARPAIAVTLGSCAELAWRCAVPILAPRLWAAAEALREQLGAPMWPIDRPQYEQRVAEARAKVDSDVWDAAWAGGRALSWEQAADEALAWLVAQSSEKVLRSASGGMSIV